MTDRNETENDRQSETLCYFYRHKLFKYIFMVVDDQRILEYLIVKVQVQLEQGGKKILKLPLSEDDHYAYRQVKNFLECEKEGACDGLIVTGLNALIYRHGAKAIELLNTSRDAFSRFRLPIAFVVNLEILKRIIRGAPDLYNMRDLPDLHFEGTWAPDMDILTSSFRDYSQHELTNIDLKIQLIEEQLKRTKVKGKIDDDGLNNMVIPLLILYLEQGNLKKMKSLYKRYIKGNEHRVKDGDVLDRYRRKTAKPVQPLGVGGALGIQDEQDKKYIEDRIESRRHFIQEGEWDKAAEITFELEEYLTLHGFPQRSMEFLQELEGKKLDDKNRAIVYHRMGNLFLGFGDYDAALTQYQMSLEIKEKMVDIKGVSTSLLQIGLIYQFKGDYEVALAQFQKSMEIAEKIGDIKGVNTNLHQIGRIYQEKGDDETALTQYRKSMEIAEKIGDRKGAAYSLGMIGQIHQNKGAYDKALENYQKVKKISEEIDDKKSVSIALHQIGMTYQDKGDYDAALTHYEKAKEIFEKIGDIANMALSMGQMGDLYFQLQEFEPALKHSIQAFLIFEKIGSPNAYIVKNNIALCRQKIPEERFQAILKEFEIDPKVF